MMARLGAIIAPLIISLGDRNKDLPFLVFGAASLLGSLTAFFLPETLNRKLPKNLLEAEKIKIF